MEYRAEPQSRKDIRGLALGLRKQLGLESVLYFNVVEYAELVLPLLRGKYSFAVVERRDLPENKHAETDVVNHIIYIRKDVYDGAVNGKGRDRMTVAHELGHYLLTCSYGIRLYREFGYSHPRECENPEWQAKAFAGELLCPFNLIGGMNPAEIAELCGVSLDAARTHYNIKNGIRHGGYRGMG